MFYDFTDEGARERKTIYFAPTFPPVSGHKRSGRSGCTCIDALVAHKKGRIRMGGGLRRTRLASTRFLQAAYRARRCSYVLHPCASCTPFPISRLPLVFLPSLVQISTSTFVSAIPHSRTEMDNSTLFFSIARACDKGGNQYQSGKSFFFSSNTVSLSVPLLL